MPDRLSTMLGRVRPSILAIALVATAGCGGAGLGLSGGSIPTGTVTGKLALPSGQAPSNPTTTATEVDTGQSLTVRAELTPSGTFTITGVPVSTDVELTFISGSNTLKTVIPATEVTSTTPVDIGSVDDATTVAAVAIETEIAAGIDDAATIVSTQFSICAINQGNSGETVNQQNDDIDDPTARKNSANRLIAASFNFEIGNVFAGPSPQNENVAIDGVLSYALETGGTAGRLSTTERQGLVNAEEKLTNYSSTQVAAALMAAGVATNAAAVVTADLAQRKSISGFTGFGGISPLEAVAIAACPSSAGGFNLTSTQLSAFVDSLTSTPVP